MTEWGISPAKLADEFTEEQVIEMLDARERFSNKRPSGKSGKKVEAEEMLSAMPSIAWSR